jgi:hypothetical protein
MRASALLAVLGLACAAGPVLGHGTPLPLAVWGDFDPAAARCQRTLGRAAAQCALDVWQLRRACIEPQLQGAACNLNATTIAVRDARQRALDKVEAYCDDTTATSLQFLGLREALGDVTSVCRQLERELITAVYGPALTGSSADYVVGEVGGRDAACLDAGADRATELLRFAAREQRKPLDRMAGDDIPADDKNAMVARARLHTARTRARVAARLAATCDGAAFQTTYGRSIDAFLADLAGRADCLTGSVYVQDAVLCPAPMCGNGMEEAGEECDDGDADDADTCRADCVRTDCPVFPSTFDLIQQAIFDSKGCSDDLCHGDARSGGLDLRIGDAYDNLVDVPSTSSDRARVEPGDHELSRLWLLLAKGTLGRNDVPGNAMPLGLPPLSADELEALRLWISAGAPPDGTVAGTGELLDACLPPPPPLSVP